MKKNTPKAACGCPSSGLIKLMGKYFGKKERKKKVIKEKEKRMYLVFTRMPGDSYRRRLGSLLLYLCDVFRAL